MAAGIYIHIPFCIRKCHYCDFFSKAVDNPEVRKMYTRALLQEIAFYGAKYGKEFQADTIFFGGGTPSLMEPELIDKIISSLKKNFSIDENAEVSMECNPATLTPKKLEGYKEAGVNRLSIGVQSLWDDVLEDLGRLHNSKDAIKTFKMARKAGFDNISLDLMFSVPKLDIPKWRSVVKRSSNLEPDHISFYSLEFAEGTEFWRRLKAREIEEQLPIVDRTMYHMAVEILEKKGYHQYEISNMALPGKECEHNKKYWTFEDYMALGAGAHGFIKNVRYSNVCDIDEYISTMKNQDISNNTVLGKTKVYGADCVDSYTVNTIEDNISEYVFTALRMNKGVDLIEFRNKFERNFWDVYADEKKRFERYIENGDAEMDIRHIAITQRGMDISNRIMALFV